MEKIKKRYYCDSLPIGNRIQEVFLATGYSEIVDDNEIIRVRFSLADAKGKCEAEILIDKLEYELEAYTNSVVMVEGFVSFFRKNPYIRLQSIDIIDPALVDRDSLVVTITEAERQASAELINMVIENIQNTNYRKICRCVFSEETLNALAFIPYSLTSCNYTGAPLIVVNNLVRMAGNCAAVYNGYRPSVYGDADVIDLDLVYASILLSVSAKTAEFRRFPFQRTSISVFEGSFELVWQTVVHYAAMAQVNIADKDMQYLCSVMKDIFISETRPVLKEGHLVKKILSMYLDLANYDACLNRFANKGLLNDENIAYAKGVGYIHKKTKKMEDQ